MYQKKILANNEDKKGIPLQARTRRFKKSIRNITVPSLELLETRWLLSTVTWAGAAGGNWNVATNWTPQQVPGADDDAIINAGATISITDDQAPSTVTAAAGSTITISSTGRLGLRDGGTLGGQIEDGGILDAATSEGSPVVINGTLDVTGQFNDSFYTNNGTININGANAVLVNTKLLNNATINIENGPSLGTATVTNSSTGSINFTDDDDITGFNILINSGLIDKTGGTGTTTVPTGGNLIDLGGTIESQSGTLEIQSDFWAQNTTLEASANSAVEYVGATQNFSNDMFVSGTVTGSGAGNFIFGAGTLTTGVPSNDVGQALTSGTINFPQGFAQATGITVLNGSLGKVINTGSLQFTGDSEHPVIDMDNKGTVTVSGTGDLGFGPQTNFLNDTTGILDFTSDAGVDDEADGHGGTYSFTNEGLIEKTGGTGVSTWNALDMDDVGGTISVQSGTMAFPQHVALQNSIFTVAANSEILFANSDGSGTGTTDFFSGTLTGSGAGHVVFGANIADTANPDNSSASSGAILNFPDGFAEVTGMEFDGGGATEIVNQGFLDYSGANQHNGMALVNQGTIRVTGAGDLDVNRSGEFINGTTGVLDFATDAGVTNDNGGSPFINEGLIEKTGGTGISTIGDGQNVNFNNEGGTFDVESGTLSIANGTESFDFTIPDNGIVAAPGATFELGGNTVSLGIHLQGNLSISGGGVFELTGGILTGPDSNDGQDTLHPATLNFANHQFIVDGGAFGDNQLLINEGFVDFETGDLGNLINEGTFNVVAGGTIRSGGGFFNEVGANLNFNGANDILAFGNNGNIFNSGTITVDPGTGNTFDFSEIELSNSGTIVFGAGTTNLPWVANQFDFSPGLFPDSTSIPAGSTFDLQSGATVTVATSPSLTSIAGTLILGSGTSFPAIANVNSITGELQVLSGETFGTAGDVTNNGTLSVGGTVTVNGNYTQVAAQNSSTPPTLDFQVGADPGASGAPDFTVTGNTALAGDLTASYASGYTTTGNTWTVATFDTPATGSFADTSDTGPDFTPTVTASQIMLLGIANTSGGGTGGTGAPDLDVTSVATPNNFTPGQSETFMWTITEVGGDLTSGNWQDSVYLSTDSTLSLDDVLLGRVSETGSLAANESYTGNLTLNIPALGPGSYHLIVVTDSLNSIGDTNRANNTGASSAASVAIPTLTLGSPTNDTISASQQKVYSITLQAGQNVSLAVTLADSFEANIYISKGSLPTPQAFDQSATSPDQTSANFLLSAAQAGTYFILIFGRPDITSAETFTITPTLNTFGPASITPTTAINTGSTAITLTGSEFTPSTTVNLVSGSTTIPSTAVTYINSTTLRAAFNIGAITPGQYDVQTVDGSQTESLPQAFTVNASVAGGTAPSSGPGQLVYSLSAPSFIRAGETGTITLFYENAGGSDIPAPIFTVESDNASFEYPGDSVFTPGGIDVMGIDPDGAAGTLSPGASGSISISFEQNTSGAHVTSNFDAFVIPTAEGIDWDLFRNLLQPINEQADAWNQIYNNFESLVGNTEGSFANELQAVATALGDQGNRTGDVAALQNYIFQIAGNFGQISESYYASVFGRGVSDPYNVTAQTDGEGNVTIGNGESELYFLHLATGGYANGSSGDFDTLNSSGGFYFLTAPNGDLTTFNATTGDVQSITDTNNNQTFYSYSSGNLVTKVTAAYGQVTTLAYNNSGQVSQLTDPQGRITTFTYDGIVTGNLLTITNSAGTTTFHYSNPSNHEVTEVDFPNGTHEFYTYDSFGRLSEEFGDNNLNDLKFSYDNLGNITETDANGDVTHVMHGEDGAIVGIDNPLGDIFSTSYGSQNTPASTTDALGQSTSTTYDNKGNITDITNANGDQTSFTYNSDSEPLTVTDGDNNTTNLSYDEHGNLTSETDPDNQTSTYTYNSTGETQSSTTAVGRVVNNTYNSLGQITSQTFSDGSTDSFTYDAHGNILTAADTAFGTETFTYDSADRLLSVTYPNGLSLNYTYNSHGQLASMVDQTGFTTKYSYNPEGMLANVSDASGNSIASYTYDFLNRVTHISYGNGTSTAYTYDSAGNILSVTNDAADGSVASSFVYTYTRNGQVATVTSVAGMTSYAYDADNQLIDAVLPSGETIHYIYDAAGNRISVVDSVNGTTNYTTNDLNQYTASTGATYTYDADGNLTSQTDASGTTTYSYNDLNELASMTVNGVTTTFTYDALGNRVASTTGGVITDNLISPTGIGNLIGQFTAGGAAIAQYAYGDGLTSQVDSGGNTSYFNFDATGNTADLTNSSGTVANAYTYDPFGLQLSSVGTTANIFTYSGQSGVISIGSNNYLTRTRLYDATSGRFTQRDLVGFNGGDTNLYRYVQNNPVNYIDPSGEIIGLPIFVDPTGLLSRVASDVITISYNAAFNASSTAYAGGEPFVSTMASNTGTFYTEASADLIAPSTEGALPNLGSYFLGGPAAGEVATPLEFAVTFGGSYGPAAPTVRTVTLTTEGAAAEGAAAAGTGLVTVAPTLVYGALKYNLEYNKAFPDGTPLATQDVLNLNDIYRRILSDPLGAQLLKNYQSDGNPVSQDDLTFTLQLIAQSQRLRQTQSVTSHDPNEIIGPAGFGSQNFIAANTLLPYEIDFTNEATASAPAQVVTVTQQLSSALDWSTFQFGNIGFGSTTLTVPTGLQSDSMTVILSSTLAVEVVATFDAATGIAKWTFTSIDPSTGDVPSDPLSGFLPPDVTSPQGEGFVDYTVQPSAAATTGTVISAQATVVFDNNPAINTTTITNTLDAAAPTSTVTALPATATSTYFNLTWSGSDDAGGSGLTNYTIFVSEDGGDFTPFLSDTTATSAQFIGTPGHSYAFYSIATDNAGNQQLIPNSPQASTTIPAIARTIQFGGKTKATYTDSGGNLVTITLSSGTGMLSFLANGNADPISMVLSNTTAKSTLTIKVAGGTTTLGTVTINGSLKSFTAPDANFTQTFTITGTLGSLSLGDETLTESTINIEGASVPTTIKLGTAHDLTLTDASAIKSLSAIAWTAGIFNADAITAPSIGTLTVKGDFDPAVHLTASGLDLKSEKITGNITGGSLTTAGSVGTISANSVAAAWTSTIAGAATSVETKGDFDGQLTAASLTTAKIGGNLSGATLNLTGSSNGFALKTLSVTKTASNSTILSIDSIDTVTVGGMASSRILIGVPSTTTALPNDASVFTNNSTLVSFTTNGTTPFSNAIIAAATIDKAKLANVAANNNGIPFGLSTKSLESFTLTQSAANPIVYTKKSSPSVLANLPRDLKVELV